MSAVKTTEQAFLTADEASKLLRVPKATVYLLAARGELPGAKRFGKHLRILRAALLAPPDPSE